MKTDMRNAMVVTPRINDIHVACYIKPDSNVVEITPAKRKIVRNILVSCCLTNPEKNFLRSLLEIRQM